MCRLQMLQKPKIIDPNKLQMRTLENLTDIRAWHMSCVEVNAPRKEMAIDAMIKESFHVEFSCRRPSCPDVIIDILASRRCNAATDKELVSISWTAICILCKRNSEFWMRTLT
jgi:hypothetical protein